MSDEGLPRFNDLIRLGSKLAALLRTTISMTPKASLTTKHFIPLQSYASAWSSSLTSNTFPHCAFSR